MNKVFLFLIISAVLYPGCKDKNKTKAVVTETAVDSSTFFQTSIIFQRDINELDSTPYFIYKISQFNDKKDSTAINTAAFKQVASTFLVSRFFILNPKLL